MPAAGGAPGGKVSWRVEALRNDLRMRLHGAPVEREKTGTERGKYQHSEYNGEPAEMGIDYVAERGVFSACAVADDVLRNEVELTLLPAEPRGELETVDK